MAGGGGAGTSRFLVTELLFGEKALEPSADACSTL